MHSERRPYSRLLVVLVVGTIVVAGIAFLHSQRASYRQRNAQIVRELGRINEVEPAPAPVTSNYTDGFLNLRTGYRTEADYTFSAKPSVRQIDRTIRRRLGEKWREETPRCLINSHGELVAYGLDAFDPHLLRILVDAKGGGLCDDYTSVLES